MFFYIAIFAGVVVLVLLLLLALIAYSEASRPKLDLDEYMDQ